MIPAVDADQPIKLNEVLNPSPDVYGQVTKYLAIDCEMDQIRA